MAADDRAPRRRYKWTGHDQLHRREALKSMHGACNSVHRATPCMVHYVRLRNGCVLYRKPCATAPRALPQRLHTRTQRLRLRNCVLCLVCAVCVPCTRRVLCAMCLARAMCGVRPMCVPMCDVCLCACSAPIDRSASIDRLDRCGWCAPSVRSGCVWVVVPGLRDLGGTTRCAPRARRVP